MSQTPNDLNDPGRNSGNGADDATPRKRGGALLWLLLLVALLLLGWWWFSQRTPEMVPEPAPGTVTGEPAPTAAADAEKAEARKKAEQARAKPSKPSKPSKPAVARATEARPLAGSPQPEYPRDAQRRGQGGRVLLRVDVAADGTATNVDFVKRSGTPELDRAAMNAVRKWRFAPARLNGKPVASSVNVPIDFVLPKS